jgi:hypothetical protein
MPAHSMGQEGRGCSLEGLAALGVIFSGLPQGSQIRNPYDQLKEILSTQKDPIIQENFSQNRYGQITQLSDGITMLVVSGCLSSWSDGTYEVKPDLQKVARYEADQIGFSEKEKSYLKSLGSRLSVL